MERKLNLTPRQALDAQMFAGTGSFGTFMSQRASTPRSSSAIEVQPYDFPMVCDYEFEPGEKMVINDFDGGHPGSAPSVVLIACYVGEHNIYDMLDSKQVTRIEEAILRVIA